MANNFDIQCPRLGRVLPFVFHHVTNDRNEPLLISDDGGQNFNPYDTVNLHVPANFATDLERRIALFHAAVVMLLGFHASQHCWNNTKTIAEHLLALLLGNLLPGPHQCQYCGNPGGICESYRTFPVHVVRLLWMIQSGSGGHGLGTWQFPAQAPVVRFLQYELYTDATNQHPQSQYACPNWIIHHHSRVGPTCVMDGIRLLCDYNVQWPQFGTMPRP